MTGFLCPGNRTCTWWIKGGSALGPVTAEKLTELFGMMISSRPDERRSAVNSIKKIPTGEMTRILSDPELPTEVLDFFARHSSARPDWVKALRENTSLPDYLRNYLGEEGAFVDNVSDAGAEKSLDIEKSGTAADNGESEEKKHLSIELRIQQMNVGEKIKMALKGDKETRRVLIKDTNREVYMSVLENPGMKESEVELLTKNTGTNSEILRTIGRNREWTGNRNVVKSLLLNPKTPLDVSVRFLPRLSLRELELIDKSRSLPSALRANAKRLIAQKRKSR